MKVTEIAGLEKWTSKYDLENLFHVYTDYSEGDSKLYYNINRALNFKNVENLDQTLYTIYTIKHNDTWNLISHREYKTIRLWWLLCLINDISDPTVEPEVGANIKILKLPIVDTILKGIRQI